MFSSLYSAFMLILFSLILRGVSFEFRGKVDDPRWRKIWDTCIFIGSFVPALLFGVAFANIFQGIPIDKNGLYHGTFFTLLNPYGILGGVLFVTLFLTHGALWLAIKSEGELHERSVSAVNRLWPVLLVVVAVFLVASKFYTRLYENYMANPILFIVILMTVLALFGIKFFLTKKAFFKAWFSSALTIVGAIFFGIIGLYPNLLPSSIHPEYNLTAHNASSSPLTLKIMLIVVIIFIPVVVGFQVWAYHLFKGKVTTEDLTYEEAY
jgi:cytochrome d ubiquinol oxidase subunit II